MLTLPLWIARQCVAVLAGIILLPIYLPLVVICRVTALALATSLRPTRVALALRLATTTSPVAFLALHLAASPRRTLTHAVHTLSVYLRARYMSRAAPSVCGIPYCRRGELESVVLGAAGSAGSPLAPPTHCAAEAPALAACLRLDVYQPVPAAPCMSDGVVTASFSQDGSCSSWSLPSGGSFYSATLQLMPVVVVLGGDTGHAAAPRWWHALIAARLRDAIGAVVVVVQYDAFPLATAPLQAAAVLAALRWVRANIMHYGGDAANVTLLARGEAAHIAACALTFHAAAAVPHVHALDVTGFERGVECAHRERAERHVRCRFPGRPPLANGASGRRPSSHTPVHINRLAHPELYVRPPPRIHVARPLPTTLPLDLISGAVRLRVESPYALAALRDSVHRLLCALIVRHKMELLLSDDSDGRSSTPWSAGGSWAALSSTRRPSDVPAAAAAGQQQPQQRAAPTSPSFNADGGESIFLTRAAGGLSPSTLVAAAPPVAAAGLTQRAGSQDPRSPCPTVRPAYAARAPSTESRRTSDTDQQPARRRVRFIATPLVINQPLVRHAVLVDGVYHLPHHHEELRRAGLDGLSTVAAASGGSWHAFSPLLFVKHAVLRFRQHRRPPAPSGGAAAAGTSSGSAGAHAHDHYIHHRRRRGKGRAPSDHIDRTHGACPLDLSSSDDDGVGPEWGLQGYRGNGAVQDPDAVILSNPSRHRIDAFCRSFMSEATRQEVEASAPASTDSLTPTTPGESTAASTSTTRATCPISVATAQDCAQFLSSMVGASITTVHTQAGLGSVAFTSLRGRSVSAAASPLSSAPTSPTRGVKRSPAGINSWLCGRSLLPWPLRRFLRAVAPLSAPQAAAKDPQAQVDVPPLYQSTRWAALLLRVRRCALSDTGGAYHHAARNDPAHTKVGEGSRDAINTAPRQGDTSGSGCDSEVTHGTSTDSDDDRRAGAGGAPMTACWFGIPSSSPPSPVTAPPQVTVPAGHAATMATDAMTSSLLPCTPPQDESLGPGTALNMGAPTAAPSSNATRLAAPPPSGPAPFLLSHNTLRRAPLGPAALRPAVTEAFGSSNGGATPATLSARAGGGAASSVCETTRSLGPSRWQGRVPSVEFVLLGSGGGRLPPHRRDSTAGLVRVVHAVVTTL